MANTYTQMTVHMVFSTKRRLPFIQKEDFKRVHEYISGILANQEEHHKQSTFESEYRQFLILHEIEFNDKYLFD